MSSPDLVVERLAKRFADHRAVDELSFTVERGSFFSILGPSGCGKTTLLRMIAGFTVPDSGDIQIGGRSMSGVAPNRRPVNMVFQHLALFPMMSVGDNVAFGLARRGVARAERQRRTEAMLERVGLAGATHKRVDELSGGQRQRVAIARSLVLEPTLLLLDEPLGALDLKLREHMKIELKQLQAAFGTTFVYITHDQSEALVLSDHVAVMNHGRFEQLGTPQELYYAPATAFVAGFVGAANRIAGQVTRHESGIAQLATVDGWAVSVRTSGAVGVGDAVEAFVRPEVATLEREAERLPREQAHYAGEVQSLLFDGANSAVLLTEERSRFQFRVALPQTGRLADLKVGERVYFSFDAQRAICFAARGAAPSHA
ncbi:MAG TPA: ABC transporter ATP-binding protein [Steroidobacteraceae bacterium]|nr:ABC transporter ATP-binding protein [Steroidobacteraceae bacterium]